MQINLNQLREEGFEVHFDQKSNVIDIFPRIMDSDLRAEIGTILKRADLDLPYISEIMENIHEYQVLSGIRRSRNIGY